MTNDPSIEGKPTSCCNVGIISNVSDEGTCHFVCGKCKKPVPDSDWQDHCKCDYANLHYSFTTGACTKCFKKPKPLKVQTADGLWGMGDKEIKKQLEELIKTVTGMDWDEINNAPETMWSFKAKWGDRAAHIPIIAFKAACVCPEAEWRKIFKDDPMNLHLWYAANHAPLPPDLR